MARATISGHIGSAAAIFHGEEAAEHHKFLNGEIKMHVMIYTTAMILATAALTVTTSYPQHDPPLGRKRPAMHFKRVVLPAPFGPRS